MKLGIQVNNFTWEGGDAIIGPTYGSIGRKAEEAGFDSFWVMDHFFQIPGLGQAEEPMLESYSALAFIAGQTQKITLGTMVTGVTYRHPGLLVKTVTTLDVLSGGRAYLGIGAGWFEREHLALGVPFPPLKERFERLEEALQICLQMWSGLQDPYLGRHYRLGRTLNSPQPVRRSRPPILIGGSGERKTLRLVAQYADACNLFPSPDLEHKLDVLRGHCADVGRDYDTIEKTVMFGLDPGEKGEKVGELLTQLERLAGLGISEAHGWVPRVHEIEPLKILGREVVPAIAEL
jgi:F420-dependent oxidoreductase-like protein